jgi:hypothetical protein
MQLLPSYSPMWKAFEDIRDRILLRDPDGQRADGIYRYAVSDCPHKNIPCHVEHKIYTPFTTHKIFYCTTHSHRHCIDTIAEIIGPLRSYLVRARVVQLPYTRVDACLLHYRKRTVSGVIEGCCQECRNNHAKGTVHMWRRAILLGHTGLPRELVWAIMSFAVRV